MEEDYGKEICLIDIIQHYSFLYDKSQKAYKDINIKANAWDAIANAMQMPVEEVQRQWKLLREKYAKVRRLKAKKPTGSQLEDFETEWPLYHSMSFMAKHITTRKRVSNIRTTTTTPLTSPSGSSSSAWDTFAQVTGHISESEEHSNEETNIEILDDVGLEPIPKRNRSNADNPTENQPGTSKELPSTSTEMPGTSRELHGDAATPKLEKPKTSKKYGGASAQVEESLSTITAFLKDKQKPDKNLSFGQYVGMSLSDMPIAEQNFKKLKIVEIINLPYPVL